MTQLTRRATLRISRAAMTLAFLGAAVMAADNPDFSGTWKLNKSKSDLGQLGDRLPDGVVYTIEHKDPDLKTTAPGMGGNMITMKYSTEGKETVNVTGQSEAKSIAKWDGPALSIKTVRDFQGNTITSEDKWTLSDDKKNLTINRKFSSPMGDFEAKMLFEKQ